MKRICKLLLFFTASIIFLAMAFFVRAAHAIVIKNPQRLLSVLTSRWARVMVWIVAIKVTLKGENTVCDDVPYLVIANHQSYLDIIIIGSIIPTLFVAKEDVRSWPIIGWLASLGGTVYIDRKAFRGAKKSMLSIEKALENRMCVTIFPEGTSGNGETVLPFRPALFHAAIATTSTILPLTLNYETVNRQSVNRSNRDAVYWYGEMTFLKHFWEVLQLDSINVSILLHPFISPSAFPNAKDLSMETYTAINGGFYRFIS